MPVAHFGAIPVWCPLVRRSSGNFTFNIASSGSNGMLVQFFATVSGASSLIWNWGDGTQSITPATSISHTYPTTSLNYVITLSLINTCGDTLDIVHTLNEVGLSANGNPRYQALPKSCTGRYGYA
jgi:hypothetical protein